MVSDPQKPAQPNRQSLRLEGRDYRRGSYFVTINTHGGRALFGTVVAGRCVPSAIGKLAKACWHTIPEHFPQAELDEFVAMPNHVHGILHLRLALGEPWPPPRPRFGQPLPGALGTVVGAYKAAVTRAIRRTGLACQAPVWHRNYWDVLVRDARALAAIRAYIRDNPANYDTVMQCGEPRCLGNAGLLALPTLGFVASRGGEGKPHAPLPLRRGEAILSGFLSPMERAVFRAGLVNRKPLIWVKPWALEEGTERPDIRQALAEGRLLILSPFRAAAETPSARRAAWCNHYVVAHADRIVVGHLNPDGQLACALSEAVPDKPITLLTPDGADTTQSPQDRKP
jgi:hypothetical protein